MRKILILALVLGVLLAAAPAMAITAGQEDTNNTYDNVALLVFFEEDSAGALTATWRCTGTLVATDVILTAGHCTYGAAYAFATFGQTVSPDWNDSQFDNADGSFNRQAWFDHVSGNYLSGSGESHWEYNDFWPEFPQTYDVGVVVLDKPAVGVDPASIAALPDDLDKARGKNGYPEFTSVGYGVQSIVPRYRADWVRWYSTGALVNLKSANTRSYSVQLTGNPGARFAESTGGTCFGDSGGPLFFEGELVGVTSFGLNNNCVGPGFSYLVGSGEAWDFVSSFLD
ncbi:MAG: trypsin-like serine protease [Acidimicrobiia bacterium]|nr:trypsin-like serine protease [Acidimicrobiia bacterium]